MAFAAGPPAVESAGSGSGPSWRQVAGLVWVRGSAATGLWLAVRAIGFGRVVRRARPADASLRRAVAAVAERTSARVAVVGESPVVARVWATPLAFLFIDGGHGVEPARLDHDLWTPHVAPGGTLAIHVEIPDTADGGQAPNEQIYLPALASGRFTEVAAVGSLRLLIRK